MNIVLPTRPSAPIAKLVSVEVVMNAALRTTTASGRAANTSSVTSSSMKPTTTRTFGTWRVLCSSRRISVAPFSGSSAFGSPSPSRDPTPAQAITRWSACDITKRSP